MANRFSYSSGVGEAIEGVKLGMALSDRAKKAKMDKEAGEALTQSRAPQTTETIYGGKEGLDMRSVDSGPTQPMDFSSGKEQTTGYTPEQARGLNRQAAKDVYGQYGEEGAKRIAQLNNEDVSGMQMKSLKRQDVAGEKELEDTTVLGSMRAKLAEEKDPDARDKLAEAYEKELFSRRPNEAVKTLTADMAYASSKTTEKLQKDEVAMLTSLKTPESALKYFNDKYKDDGEYRIHPNADGTFSVVQDATANGGKAGTMAGPFKDWEEARQQLITNLPTLAKTGWEIEVKHQNALELQRAKNAGITARGAADRGAPIGQMVNEEGETVLVYGIPGKSAVTYDPVTGKRTNVPPGKVTKIPGEEKLTPAEIKAASDAKTKYGVLMKKVNATKDNWTTNDDGKSDAHKLALANLETHAALFPDSVPRGLQTGGTPAATAKPTTKPTTKPTAAPAGMPPGSVQHGGKWGQMKEGKFFAYKGQ